MQVSQPQLRIIISHLSTVDLILDDVIDILEFIDISDNHKQLTRLLDPYDSTISQPILRALQ